MKFMENVTNYIDSIRYCHKKMAVRERNEKKAFSSKHLRVFINKFRFITDLVSVMFFLF